MEPVKIQYDRYRSQFKDGDILLYKGRNLFSKIIQWKTQSAYSHAGVVVWWNQRLMVLEAVSTGVIARPISYNLEHYSGDIDYYRPRFEITAAARLDMAQYAQEQLGKSYAWRRIISFFFKLLLDQPLTRKDSTEPTGSYFCSEYVADIYAKFSCDLDIVRSNRFTSPDRLAESHRLELVGTLKTLCDHTHNIQSN